MRFAPDVSLGPFADSDQLWDAFRRSGHPLSSLETVDELFRYDGTRIAIVRTRDGDLLLESVVDEGERPDGQSAVEIRMITHHLPFADDATIRATMNTGFVPTRATYAAATGPVVRTVFSYLHDADGTRDHRYGISTVDAGSIDEDEMPYAHLRPGRTSVHGPYEDPFSEEAAKDMEFRLLPTDDDEIIGFFDCARAWLIRRPGHIDPLVLVTCVADDARGWVQHRLSLPVEAAVEETLVTSAPTMETYRRAKWIRRETISRGTPAGTWIVVESIDPADLDRPDLRAEKPTYDTVAEHDAAWPAFAGRKGGAAGGAPEGEGK